MFLGVVETLIVGRAGTMALGAVSLGNVWTHGTILMATGVVMGADPLLTQAYGAGDTRTAALTFQRGLVLSVLLGLLGFPAVARARDRCSPSSAKTPACPRWRHRSWWCKRRPRSASWSSPSPGSTSRAAAWSRRRWWVVLVVNAAQRRPDLVAGVRRQRVSPRPSGAGVAGDRGAPALAGACCSA